MSTASNFTDANDRHVKNMLFAIIAKNEIKQKRKLNSRSPR